MKYTDWHIPLSAGELTLRQGLDSLAAVAARQQEIPLIIRLLENPKYSLPGLTLFHGAVDLQAHDRIHILLGRGLRTEDEAFTIGFTMGSTKRVRRSEEWLFGVLARHLYPQPYTFDKNAVRIFNDAVRLGGISGCQPLDKIAYAQYLDVPLHEVRKHVGLELDLLRAYYRIEQERYKDAAASQRLLD
ncbi:MAG: hypothetical protein WBO06_02505 [Gammaproteobacteria bacterium]